MVFENKCSFCGKKIPPGTGFMFVKSDGKVFWYCSKKCYVYHQERNKDPRYVTWVRKRNKSKK